jgi:hypothetical protein
MILFHHVYHKKADIWKNQPNYLENECCMRVIDEYNNDQMSKIQIE